jgi:hypothetical protein
MGPNPFAFFDALAIGARLQRTLDGAAISEIHLFAYLACLLSLYRGNPVSDWGYDFVATENGSPFSAELERTIPFIIREGLAKERNRYIRLTDRGYEEYRDLNELEQNRRRGEFLDASCSSVLALPLGVIRSAMSTDHDMKLAAQLGDTRRLLTETAIGDLHDAFSALSEEIGIQVQDLMVPAVVWLNYLAHADAEVSTFQQ